MFEICSGVGVLAIEVAAVGEQFGSRNFPGAFVLFPVVPPLEAAGEFFELDRLSLGVVLSTFGRAAARSTRRLRLDESGRRKEVRRNARVGSEDTVGQADDGVEVEVFEQFFLDASADAVAEERAVGDDDGGAPTGDITLTLPSPRGRG